MAKNNIDIRNYRNLDKLEVLSMIVLENFNLTSKDSLKKTAITYADGFSIIKVWFTILLT